MKAISVFLIFIGVCLVTYLVLSKKTIGSVTNDIIGIGTANSSQKAADKLAADKLADNPDIKPPVYVPIATNKIGLTYEGRQSIYKTYNKINAPAGSIGYLADGTLLTFLNCIYRDGEYKKIVSDSGLKGILIGNLNVDGTFQNVWSEKHGYNLWDFPGAIGFLENGNMVFQEIRNAGETSEYSYYRT